MSNELPQNIRDLIAQVAKKTKLRKAERTDVARELTSHFQASLASGKSADDVVRTYGDVRACALSLRATAIAKRSPIDRAFGLTFKWSARAVGALVLLYAVVAIYMGMDGPKVSFDAVKRYRDSLPVAKSPDQVAWPAYRDALAKMGLGNDDPQSKSEGALAAKDAPLPTNEKWTAASEWIAAHQPQIAEICAASKRPLFGFPVGIPASDADAVLLGKNYQSNSISNAAIDNSDLTELPLLHMLLPHLGVMRDAGRILAADMMLAVDQGDGERATRDAEAMIALSIHLTEGRILIGDLVGMAIRSLATNKILMALEWKPSTFTDAQLKRLQTALGSVSPALARPDFTSELLMFEDFVQRFYTDDGHGDGRFAPQWEQMKTIQTLESSSGPPSNLNKGNLSFQYLASCLSKPYAACAVAGRKETLDHYNASLARCAAIPKGTLSDINAALTMADHEFEMRYGLECLLMPAIAKIAFSFQIDRAVRDACIVSIAAELYHRANEKWPASAADLAPLCNGGAPQDPWSGKPILIANDANGFRMWSVGMNGVDEQGNLEYSTQAQAAAADWVWLAPRGNLARWKRDQRQ